VNPLELRQLETFREVVRQGSFTAAARALHMTQPAVSAHVKALEVALGARLLERDGKGVRLTASGRLVLEAAETALGAVEEVARRVRESMAPERGRIVLACGDTVALHLLPPVLTAFRATHPEAEVAVQNHGSRAILELVLKREADLGIVTRPAWLDPALWARTLVADPFVLAVPREHRLAGGARRLHDLDGEAAVLLSRTTETRGLIDRGLEAAGTHLKVALESPNLEVVKAYVASGLGLSILPRLALTDVDRLRMVLLPLPEGIPPRRITVVRRKDRVPGLLATTLFKLLAEHFRAPDGPAEPS
jgi:DNA-binding transcriptional LysR family regulator